MFVKNESIYQYQNDQRPILHICFDNLREGRVSQRPNGHVPTCLYRHISPLLSDDVLLCYCTWKVFYLFSSLLFVRDIRAPVNSDWSVIAQTINVVFDVRAWVNVTLSLFYRVLLCRARLCCTWSFNTIYNIMWTLPYTYRVDKYCVVELVYSTQCSCPSSLPSLNIIS